MRAATRSACDFRPLGSSSGAAWRRCVASALLVAAIVLAPAAARAESNDDGAVSRFGVGLGAGLCTLVYTPLKLVYAMAAFPMGALVYLWSVGDTEMTERVVRSGTQGTYVVTPEHLKGQRRLDFVGNADDGPPEK